MLKLLFKNPIFLKYLTIKGVALKVIAIRNGAKHLCTVYAMTNVPALDAVILDTIPSPMFKYFNTATISTPLEIKNNINISTEH